MTVNEYLQSHRAKRPPIPAIVCADGLRLSVQASEYTYCKPRVTGADYYYEVEIGYPSEAVPELLEYAESPATPTNTVYGYVPVELVDAVIAAHGGIAGEARKW